MERACLGVCQIRFRCLYFKHVLRRVPLYSVPVRRCLFVLILNRNKVYQCHGPRRSQCAEVVVVVVLRRS